VMLLLAATLLPRLLWDSGPETAPELRQAGIKTIAVTAGRAAAWRGQIDVEVVDPARAIRLVAPSVDYRANQATASRTPWLNANGWRFIRNPKGEFVYDVKGAQAALAAAEAFSWNSNALIRTDVAGLGSLGEMLRLLGGVPAQDLAPVADIGFEDDRSAAAGEVMNLFVKGNLLFRIVPRPDPALKIHVKLGTKDYPLEDARNPVKIAQIARANLTDDRRSVRVFGSAVVVARLMANRERARVHLLNYAGAERSVDGIRVRVAGEYSKATVRPEMRVLDLEKAEGWTEFTLPEIRTYAVVDLSK
jgi:hypothetical protein